MSIAYSNFDVYFKKQFGEKDIIIMLRIFLKNFFKDNSPEFIILGNIKNKKDLGFEITITTRQRSSLKIRAAFLEFCRKNNYFKENKVIKISKIRHKLVEKKIFF